MTAQPPTSEVEILSSALSVLDELLPVGWRLSTQRERWIDRLGPDAVVAVIAPNGERGFLYAEAKRSVVTRDLASMTERARASLLDRPGRDGGEAAILLVARYFAPGLQQWMSERGISYADASGNMRVSLARPALFVRNVGAQRDPWRGPGRPKGNLTGASAARIVRALVDYRPPFTVPELMKIAGTPSGNTYRAVDFIEEQALLTREGSQIIDVSWRALLERWSKDYSFASLARDGTFLAPRGLPDLMSRLAALPGTGPGMRYAVTGSLATPKWDAYAPARNAMIYSDSPEEFAKLMDLRVVDSGANVFIADSLTTAALDRTQLLDQTVIVGPSQAAVDLLSAPGRGPEEGRALLDWMERNERDWRT